MSYLCSGHGGHLRAAHLPPVQFPAGSHRLTKPWEMSVAWENEDGLTNSPKG